MKILPFLVLLFLLTKCLSTKQTTGEITSSTGLKYTVLQQGTGEPAKKGEEVAIFESMGLLSGKVFYSIERPSSPIKFTLGQKQVIDGVDEAVTGMKVGEIRRVIVPPSLSKRQEYPDFLPRDSTLLYKIELVEIKR